jgi:hypothetical protein
MLPDRRSGEPGQCGPDCSLSFPLRLRCTSVRDLLTSDELEDAVARGVGLAFGRARRELSAADAVGSGVVLQPPRLVKGSLAPGEETTLLGRLRRAIERAAQSQALPLHAAVEAGPSPAASSPERPVARALSSRPAGPPKKSAETAPWRIRIKVDFHITPRQFFEIRKRFHSRQDAGQRDTDELLELYFPLLDKPMRATAWVVEVAREYEFWALLDEVVGRFSAARRPDEIVWAMGGWYQMRALVAQADRDHKVAARVPEFGSRGFTELRPGAAQGEQQVVLKPGAWLFTAFLPLPNVTLADLVELKPPQSVDLPLSEAGGLFTPEEFAAEAGLDWATVVREAPDFQVTVTATAFTVRRKVHERALAVLFARYRLDLSTPTRLGRVVPFTERALQDLGPALEAFLRGLADLGLPAQRGPAAGFWPPGAVGVNLTLRLPEDLRAKVLRQANAAFISAEADQVQRILQLENGLLSADRDKAVEDYIFHWRNLRKPELFAFLLDELQQRGALDAFLSAVRGLRSTDTYLKRTVAELASRGGDAKDPRVLALGQDIEATARGTWKSRYDVAAQEVWINGDQDRKVRAANESGDDKAGVVAEVDPYYSESARIRQPRPEILERLREPTRKKVCEIIRRMVCAPGEEMTREELLQKATQEAAKELPPLEEKDLVNVTLRKSLRILKLESRLEAGVQEIYVHYQPVQQVGNNPWMPAGDVIVQEPFGFEAYLTYYHVRHLEEALTVFLLAETVVLGGVMIIELGIASLYELLFFVSVQLALYWWTTDADDQTLEGYLMAALKGELEAVGFKGLSGAVKGLGGFVANALVESKLVSEIGTKWIVFLLRGTAMSLGVGGLEATYQFAEDLLQYSHCKGWSSPEKYWSRFKWGFAITFGLEFVAIPILGPAARLALEKATDAVGAARALLSSGKSVPEITEALLEAQEKVEEAISQTVEHEAGAEIARGFKQRVADVLKALGRPLKTVGREYESRAYQALLELYAPDLGSEAAAGLRRLLNSASEHEIDALMQRLLAAKASPPDLLRALGKMNEAFIADLVKTGKLAEIGLSRRVLDLLTRDPEVGARVFQGPFKSAPAAMERFLGRLEPLAEDAQQSVLAALARNEPLPPNILLQAAEQVGVLDEPTLALLRRLRAARVRISAFFEDPWPPLDRFAEEFARLSPAQQAAAMSKAAGRTPLDILAEVEAEPVEPESAPDEEEPTPAEEEPAPLEEKPPVPPKRTLDEIVREMEGKGFSRDDLRTFMGTRKALSAPLARRVARLLDRFTLDEVKAWGKFLARHEAYLNENLTQQLLKGVPRGRLEELIGELESIRAEQGGPIQEWSAEELSKRVDVTIHPGEPPPISEFGEADANEVLRAQLIKRAGGAKPPPGYAAHHIIPDKEYGPGLDWLRERLRAAGRDINDADNGVFLAGSKATPNPELTRLHNSYIHAGPQREYAYTLTRRLFGKHGADFITELNKIAHEMSNSTFDIPEIPSAWRRSWQPGMTTPADPGVQPEWIDEE